MRFVTFNILHGRSVCDGSVDIDRLATAVKSLNPDVLALQEVDRGQPRSHLADLTEVAAAAMDAVAHRFVAALSGTPGATWIAATGREQPGTASYGIALLSRYPADNWQVLRLPRVPFSFPMWLPGPRKFAIVREEPRAAVAGRLRTPFGALTVVNTHLSFVPGWNRLQLRALHRDVEAFDGPHVLMGDLNMTPPTPERITGYRSLAVAATFPQHNPVRQLDHIMAHAWSPHVRAGEAIETPLSDHCALAVDVEVASVS